MILLKTKVNFSIVSEGSQLLLNYALRKISKENEKNVEGLNQLFKLLLISLIMILLSKPIGLKFILKRLKIHAKRFLK